MGRFSIELMNPIFICLTSYCSKTVINSVALMMKLMMIDKIMCTFFLKILDIMSPNKWVDNKPNLLYV